MKPVTVALLVLVLVVLAAAAIALSVLTGPIPQPLAFNHRLHVEELGAECTDCHLYATTGLRATIPNIDVCADCHPEALTDSPEEARLIEHIEAGEPIPWRKIYWVPDHVFFSHRRHTAVAGIECQTCHGAIETRVGPVTRRLVPLTMNRCMECHDETETSNDCLLCHR